MDKHEQLAKEIADNTGREMQAKFMKGQNEHGGYLFDRSMIKDIRDEVIDLTHYSYGLVVKRDQIFVRLNDLHNAIFTSSIDSEAIAAEIVAIAALVKKL